MIKIFIKIAAALAALFFTYWAGGRIAKERCRADVAIAAVAVNTDITQTKRKINAETFNTPEPQAQVGFLEGIMGMITGNSKRVPLNLSKSKFRLSSS